MSHVTCPECGCTFRTPTTDDELRFAEDVEFAVAKRALRPGNASWRRVIRDALFAHRPVITTNVTVTNAVGRILPPSNPDPDRPRG